MQASPRVKDYFSKIEELVVRAYDTARMARSKGLDPETDVEIKLASGIGERVEGLVGPKGVAKKINEYLEHMDRDTVALKIIDDILSGAFGKESDEKLAEQAIRTSLALLTEGVVAAPIEGISKVKIETNPDKSKYLSVYYAGPIRSAGGTAQAVSVVLADYTREKLGLDKYKPTDTEVERYVEEINLYHNAVSRLQYKPTDDEVRKIVRNCPVCITGDPTADVEVDAYKDLDRIPTNRVRGGMCLVIAEGIAQKAKKLVKYSSKFGLDKDWDWIKSLIKIDIKSDGVKIEPSWKYLKEIVAGRPIFSYPSTVGGFRLRYGRARNAGLMTKAIHPAAMFVLGEFPAIGTQLKLEKPGKGCTLTTNDKIRGPFVKLKDGSCLWVEDVDTARKVKGDIEEVLFIGDMLASYGDFLKSNTPIVPSPYVEEWWVQELHEKGGSCEDPFNVSYDEAVTYSSKYGIPLHPRYVFAYNELSVDDIKELIRWLAGGMDPNSKGKRILELLLVPHRVIDGNVIIEDPWRRALFDTLSIPNSVDLVDRIQTNDPLELVNELSPFKIMPFSSKLSYVGARMGRPEKAKERKMNSSPQVLFPVGMFGGPTRSIIKASEKRGITVEVENRYCPKCKERRFSYKCEVCGTRTIPVRICPRCGAVLEGDICPRCGVEGIYYSKATLNLKDMLDRAIRKVGKPGEKLKGVIGTTSATKAFEPLEKGIIRSRYNVFVFKDGTSRFDSTNLPLTHFKPYEIGVSVEKLRKLGYLVDYKGDELRNDSQIVELFPQDVILSERAGEYFTRVAKFVDDMLESFYGLPRFYNVSKKEDLVGHLIIGLAPHTSAGVLGRIIGFTKANAWYAHPYFHAATRRDCDGDENASMLLLEALLDFSVRFLPASRGGKMDAPLVLTKFIDPSQVDDQVHEMEVVGVYPLNFYRDSQKVVMPDKIKLELVRDRLGTDKQYDGFDFSLDTTDINTGNYRTMYSRLGKMMDKVYAQLNLGKKLRAVNEKDEAMRVLNFHFLPDIYGNLRKFGEQQFRCVNCNAKYRRPPLKGVCVRCGGKLILTISEGSVRKYLEISRKIAEDFGLSDYMNQRLALVERNADSIFTSDKVKQFSLSEFM